MNYISGEEYSRAEASNAYSKASNLEKQISELSAIVKNLQMEVNILKRKIYCNGGICTTDDYVPQLHPFKGRPFKD